MIKKIVSLYIDIEQLAYLKDKEVSPSHLLTSAINQLQAQEMFLDPEYEWDNNYLFKQVAKAREKITKMAQVIKTLEEKNNVVEKTDKQRGIQDSDESSRSNANKD